MNTAGTEQLLWAPRAWVGGRWADAVLLAIDAQGHWCDVQTGQAAPPQATVLPGAVLPGLVNAHSHAFQRAFAGLAERRDSAHDDFWSWRDRMYGVALRITPGQLQAVATQLYGELLVGGYTQVCEFHYLHHDEQGQPYADPLAMSRALCGAAAATGMGLTLLPVLYERAGFSQPTLRHDQRRFATTVSSVLALRDGVRALQLPLVNAGVAVHSLRAAVPASLHALCARLAEDAGPIHIHIAEQTAEVADCQAATGKRPIEWLARELPLDARWQLVHATHALPSEIDAVAATGAGVVICPSTEANLGDGLADLPRWLPSGTPISVGSDSQVSRSAVEELRWLEYGQRLALRQRNVAAHPGTQPATAARLFERVRSGGGAAAGFARWGLQVGARADLLVLDETAAGLLGAPPTHTLDALVFATGAPAFSEVWVAGRRVVAGGVHRQAAPAATGFSAAMRELWAAPAG
jgi:formimidoylglutamate deiminase